MARPTKKTPELINKVLHYIDHFEEYGDAIPSVASLAGHVDVRRTTLHDWAAEDAQFSDMLQKLKEKQESVLLNNGLGGKFNSQITKLVLAKHDYHDKVDQTVSGGDKPVETKWTIEIVRPPKED